MKKMMMALVSVVMMFVLTGCGTETLTCTMSQNQTGMTMDQKMDATFVNNEVTKMDIEISAKVDDTYVPYLETMKTSIESQYKTYEENGGKVEVTAEGNVIKANISLDLDKMSSKQKKNLSIGNTFGTKSATAKELEKQGYTCK